MWAASSNYIVKTRVVAMETLMCNMGFQGNWLISEPKLILIVTMALTYGDQIPLKTVISQLW